MFFATELLTLTSLNLSVMRFLNHTAWYCDDNLYAAANLLVAKFICIFSKVKRD